MISKKIRRHAVLHMALFTILTASFAQAQTAQEIAQNAFASTVLLVMEDANGQPLSLGSGFFVHNNEIVTNLHVVAGAARGYAKLIGQTKKYEIEGLTGVDLNYDLAILKASTGNTRFLTLGDSESVQIGDSVYAVGNPQGLEGTFSQGIVSSIREIGTGKFFQMTAPISPGSSGGPVLSAEGEVIGVSVATYKGGQNLNFAIPVSYLKSLLGKTGPVKPLKQTKSATAQRSVLSDLGGRTVDGVSGGQLAWTWTELQSGEYTFSLQNKLRENIKNVYCLVIFYDGKNNPIEIDVVRHQGLIPPGLARRVTSKVDGSVQKLTTPQSRMNPKTKIEFRILNFEIVN